MPRPKADGYSSKRIAGDMQDACLENARRIARAINDLIDGDDDVTEALSALNELGLVNVEMLVVQQLVADGNLTEAEAASMRLVASNPAEFHSKRSPL